MRSPADIRPALEVRSRLLQALRRFFVDRAFTEVETPVRLAAPPPEPHIDAEPAGDDAYLRTSPELHLKRLLAAGYTRIFELGPCFRKGEQGPLHSPEYTMLEWYRTGADYLDVLEEARALLTFVVREVLGSTTLCVGGQRIDVTAEWECLTVREAFLRAAGWDPTATFDPDRFDLDLVDKVEPSLPADRPVVLMDYPVQVAALARCRPGPPAVAERWELYVARVELANAFTELTDPVEQERRFEEWSAYRASQGKPVYPFDREFLDALRDGLPDCGGVAMGVDRLAMLLTDSSSIDGVRAFRL